MSHEPKKPIEPLLEAYAKKRREEAGAPLELHPVNRRHLQDAVAEMRGGASTAASASDPKPSFWAGWKFPFMVGLSFTSVLFICGLVWLRNQPAQEKESMTNFAKLSQTPAPEESSVGKRGAYAPVPEPMVLADQTPPPAQAPASNAFFALEKDSVRHNLAASAPASTIAPTGAAAPAPLPASPMPVASPAVTTVADSGIALAENKAAARSAGQLEQKQPIPSLQAMDRKRDELATAAPEKSTVKLEAAKPAAKEAEVTLALGEAIKSKNFAVEFQSNGAVDGLGYKNSNLKSFSQTAPVEGLRRNFNSPPPPVVLQNFYMERSGNALRVIDADGSTYVGVVGDAPVALQMERAKKITSERSLAESRQQEAKTKYQKAAAPMPAAKGGEENQLLYFEVNGLNRTLKQNVLLNGNLVLTQQLQLTVTNTNNPASQSLPVSQIQGRATVGKTQFDLNAVPASGK